MPRKVYRRLVEFGIIEDYLKSAPKQEPVGKYLDTWGGHRRSKGTSEQTVKTDHTRIVRILARAGVGVLTDISRKAVSAAAEELRAELNLSDQTHNHGLAACKAFTRWCEAEGLVELDPLRAIQRCRVTRRMQRRPLTHAELMKLIATTSQRGESWGMTGESRALLYETAARTGLRARELRELACENLRYDCDGAWLVLRTGRRIPLRGSTAEALRRHTRGQPADALLFRRMPPSTHTAEMLRADLEAAGIPAKTTAGCVDFHALRETFVASLCALPGLNAEARQQLVRVGAPRGASRLADLSELRRAVESFRPL
jgi:integrase